MEGTTTPPVDPKVTLLQEIRDDLRKQGDLKKDLLKEIKPAGKFSTLLEISKHPVFLLILGSLFGGLLSSCYQHREWRKQQALLQQRQQLEQKRAVRDEIVGALVDAYSAAQSAVRPLFYENTATYTAIVAERTKEWDKASLSWQINRTKIEQKLALYFKTLKAQEKLNEITEIHAPESNLLFVEVNNALGKIKANPQLLDENNKKFEEQSKDFTDFKDSVRKKILEPVAVFRIKTKEMLQILQDEIQDDQKDDSESLWSYLF